MSPAMLLASLPKSNFSPVTVVRYGDWLCSQFLRLTRGLAEVLPECNADAGNSRAAAKGNVSVVSDVEGADIYIDAKFVGNAPATSAPPSGPHKIEVRDQTAGRGNGTLKGLKIVMCQP